MSVLLVFYLATFQPTSAMRYAITRKGNCQDKKGSALITLRKLDCEKIGGRFTGSPKSFQWVDCYLDWCRVPFSGKISSSTIYTICPKDEQTRKTLRREPVEFFRPKSSLNVKAGDCRLLNGQMKGSPSLNQWVDCYLRLCPFSGTTRNGLKGVMMSQVNECKGSKIGYGSTRLSYKDCSIMGGHSNGRHNVGNSLINCVMDFCEEY